LPGDYAGVKFGNVRSDCLILRTEAAVRRDGAGVPIDFRVFSPGPLSLTIDGQQVAGELTREDNVRYLSHFLRRQSFR
jgi:hypothetical protein